jgi:alkylation response protein AidB-like acyl-CoA dehydrogenase
MDFDITEEQEKARAEFRAFLEKEIAPIVDEREQHGPFTRDEVVQYIKKLIPFGFYLGDLGEEYGVKPVDPMTRLLCREELARVWGSLSATVGIASSAAPAVLGAPEELRARLLPRLLEGDLICCAGITEPNAGSNSASMTTRAELDGDEYVLNGTKTWISNATIADMVLALCVTDKSKGPLGISRVLVEKATSPFETNELHKLGYYCFPTGEIFFEDCRVPRDQLITTDPGSGYKRTMQGFETARTGMAVSAAAYSQAAVDASIAYARERHQFGRPIGSFQMVQEMIADMIADTEATRLLAYRSHHLIQKGVRARKESSLAKAFGCEAAVRVTARAVEIHGAPALVDTHPVARFHRDARMQTIPDGTTQIQKLIVGRESIGIKAFE